MVRYLIFGLWLIGLPAWGQAPPGLSGKSSQPEFRQSDTLTAGVPSGAYQPQIRIQRQPPQHRLSQNQPNYLVQNRIQMPKRVQPTTSTLIFFSAVMGALAFISLFTIAQYLLNREAPYGWYAFYLTVITIWLWQTISIYFTTVSPIAEPTHFFAFLILLDCSLTLSYLRFLSHFLEVPQQHPRLERWLRLFFTYSTVVFLACILEVLTWHSLYLYSIVGLVSYGGLLLLLIGIARTSHPFRTYALIASLFLMSGAFASLVLNYIGWESTGQLLRIPMFYIAVTTLLEILCFSLALGRRSYLNKVEKIQAQEQLIQQLEENRQLQQSYTLALQQQLAQRETDVLTKAHQLEEQRVSQLRSDFERRVAEAEMAGLRSQMNPHFIFNCLNSIKLYATENDSEKASEYLTKFSRLIRLVLENSRSERVKLQDELDMLQLYADMEIMRFKQKLSFSIRVDERIDTRFVEIPPLLLQPYVENAIWHGLMHKPEGGSVSVRVTYPKDDLLQLTITDDGIGRSKAAELKSKSASHRKSFGLKMTSERIALVNQLYHTQTQVTIHDLMDTDGQPAGTEVTICIPI